MTWEIKGRGNEAESIGWDFKFFFSQELKKTHTPKFVSLFHVTHNIEANGKNKKKRSTSSYGWDSTTNSYPIFLFCSSTLARLKNHNLLYFCYFFFVLLRNLNE